MLHGGAGKGPLGGGGIAGSAFFLHTVVVLVVVQCCGEAAQPRAVPTAQSKSLDDALALWKQLLASQGIPAVRSVEQTTASLRVTAALYRLMDKVTLLGLWRHKVSSTTALSLVVLWVFPASSLCKPWKATCWCEPCAAHLGTIWARPELSARSPNCSSSWNAPPMPRQAPRGGEGGRGGQLGWSCRPSPHTDPLASSSSWKRQSPACREQTGAATPTCCCSRPASCSAASCTAPATA